MVKRRNRKCNSAVTKKAVTTEKEVGNYMTNIITLNFDNTYKEFCKILYYNRLVLYLVSKHDARPIEQLGQLFTATSKWTSR